MVQWLRSCAHNAGGPGSIPGQGTRSCLRTATKSPHAATKRSHMPQGRSPMPQLRLGAAKIN